jgi:zinc protease
VLLAPLDVAADTTPTPPLAVSMHATTTTLPNGLQVIFDEDHRTPIVTTNLWYNVGSKDEAEHRNGFAHLFEHVMFQGSKHVPEDRYFRFLEQAGATSINGTTNTDRTNYFETVPANQLELALWLESDRMAYLLDHADQKTFESQREVVKNERRQNYENAPYGMVMAFVRAEVYPKDHPYHLLTIGSPEDLDAASLEDVKGFFRANYVPNNATLVVSGDFDRVKAGALVQKWFGPIPRGKDVPHASRSRPASSSRASTSAGPRRSSSRPATASSISSRTCSPAARRAASTSASSTISRSRRASALLSSRASSGASSRSPPPRSPGTRETSCSR